jgi:L-fuculose-phosphate aldolase
VAADEERSAREDIVRYCTLLWDRRLVTGTSGNVSVRLPGGGLLVTPSRKSLRELSADEVILTDAAGRSRDLSQRATSELALHLAAYRARPDARCVVHTHPTFCVVWSRTGRLFPQDTVGARETLGPVGLAPYLPPGSVELAESCAEIFSRGIDTVLMERHGLSTIGVDLEIAFVLTDLAEEAARVGYFASLAGSAPRDRDA